MTIEAYLAKARAAGLTPVGHSKAFADALYEQMDVWSNNACLGYALKGMENAGLDDNTIRAVLNGVERAFSEMSVDAAEQFLFNS